MVLGVGRDAEPQTRRVVRSLSNEELGRSSLRYVNIIKKNEQSRTWSVWASFESPKSAINARDKPSDPSRAAPSDPSLASRLLTTPPTHNPGVTNPISLPTPTQLHLRPAVIDMRCPEDRTSQCYFWLSTVSIILLRNSMDSRHGESSTINRHLFQSPPLAAWYRCSISSRDKSRRT